MVDVKEPEIKLFGMKIMLPENWKKVAVLYGGESSDEIDDENSCRSDNGVRLDDNKANRTEHEQDADEGKQQIEEEGSAPERCESNPLEKDQRTNEGESRNSHPLSGFDDPKTPTIDEDVASIHPLKIVNDQRNGTNSQQKTLKKPDKILPCPRCKSMDTKFCYYNNYNISQPRHFCRSCQRYWTAGGNMRNMQVGAGRRKTKNSASHYCHHIEISEAFQASQLDSPNGFHHLTFRPNGTVLSFGPDSQIRESMASVLNLADTEVPNGIGNGYCKSDQGTSISCKIVENGDDSSCNGSSITTSKSTIEGGDSGSLEPVMQNINSFPYPVPCLPGVPWPVAWGSAVPVSPVCPTGLPMPFYPAHYWNVPWLPFQLPTPNRKALGSSPDSPLGKHSRDGELLKSNKTESRECLEEKNWKSSIVVPKTLRFDNPDEAAKSPIWATLGMKDDSMRREGLFKAFQPRSDKKKPVAMASTIMHANPAALSRSLVFHESA